MTPHRSHWLNQSLSEPAAPTLTEDTTADVAILGGGFVGLWTAIRLREQQPDLDVVVLERDVCGGGASGRNGGFVLSWWPKLPSLVRQVGEENARWLGAASERAIDEVAEFCAEHGIDADFRHGGWLWTATSAAHMGAWSETVAYCERLGVRPFRELPDTEVAARTGSPVHLAGVLCERAATVQPAALVRGLRRVALERGVRIHENSEVTSFSRAAPSVVQTPAGRVRAHRVVIATNAWAGRVRELSRMLVVVSSDIVVTDPIPDRLAEIGWTGDESITDSQLMVSYYRTTADGRIAYGKGGWGIGYGSRFGASFDRDGKRAAEVTRTFRRVYPSLADVPIAGDWCGPIDRTDNGLPIFGALPTAPNVLYGIGFSGNGVGPSLMAGRILASLALGRRDEWSGCGLVDRTYRRFPPRPVTFAGAHIVRSAVARKEAAEIDGRRPRRLDVRLSELVPSGLEDS